MSQNLLILIVNQLCKMGRVAFHEVSKCLFLNVVLVIENQIIWFVVFDCDIYTYWTMYVPSDKTMLFLK